MEEIKKFLQESNYFSDGTIEEMIKCIESGDYCAFWIYFHHAKNIEKFDGMFLSNAYNVVKYNKPDDIKNFHYTKCANRKKYDSVELNVELFSDAINTIRKEIDIPDSLYNDMISNIRKGAILELWDNIRFIPKNHIGKALSLLFHYLKERDIVQYELLTNSYYFLRERYKVIDIYRGPEFLKEIKELLKSE